MWLKLQLDGVKLYFKVDEYTKSTCDNWDSEWCGIELTVQSGNWLDYSQTGTLLLAYEIEQILSSFEELLEDKISEVRTLEFIEPDFKIILKPKKDLRQDSQYTYIKPGYEIEDINAEFQITFWNGAPTDNYLSLCMNRKDILAFIMYLKVITKQISKTDKIVQEYFEKEIILEY